MKDEINWTEKEGIIYIPFDHCQKNYLEWIEYLCSKGVVMSCFVKQLVESYDSTGIDSISKIAILKGESFKDNKRTNTDIRYRTDDLGFVHGDKLSLVVAFIVRCLSDKQIDTMGFSRIVTMHHPTISPEGVLSLLETRLYESHSHLCVYGDTTDCRWSKNWGFAVGVL
ncbi:MAG: hypothetical protein ACI9GH_000196 [Candidatus Paceibacteria bacterium]|jgi:hypothetical protein